MNIDVRAIEYTLHESNEDISTLSNKIGISESKLKSYIENKSAFYNVTLSEALKIQEYFQYLLETFENRYGVVYYQGNKYILTEEAELSNEEDDVYYLAKSLNEDNVLCIVFWKPYENYKDIEDWSLHCNWDEVYMISTV